MYPYHISKLKALNALYNQPPAPLISEESFKVVWSCCHNQGYHFPQQNLKIVVQYVVETQLPIEGDTKKTNHIT